MPAAAVIPAPIAYINAVAVKTLVVTATKGCEVSPCSISESSTAGYLATWGHPIREEVEGNGTCCHLITLSKSKLSKQLREQMMKHGIIPVTETWYWCVSYDKPLCD